MSDLVRTIDWSTTQLGPVKDWPQSLKTALSICFTSQSPIIIWWRRELFQFYNEPYRPVLGTSKHPQAMGSEGPRIWPEIWHIMGPLFDKVFQGRSVRETNQFMFLDRNGYLEETYFTHAHSPIRDETGQVAGVFTVVNETTDSIIQDRRLKTLHHLALHTRPMETLYEAMQKSIQALEINPYDIPFALLYQVEKNATAACPTALFGLPQAAAEDFFALPVEELLTEKIFQAKTICLSEALRQSLQGQWGHDPVQASLYPLISPGTLELTAILILGMNPHLPFDEAYQNFLSLTTGQITTTLANAVAYMEERARAEALAELDRAKTTFFNNVSHEFRTPLTLSLGPLEAILSDTAHPLTPEQRAGLEMVQRNELRQLKLVNTLLDFSRIAAGRLEAVFLPVDLAQLTRDLASTFRTTIEEAGLHFLVDCPPLPEAVYVDRDMWEKIVLNLLSNAFKFTLEGTIRISLHLNGEKVEFVVEDTGVGVSADELPHLFERFYRARQTRARSYEGSGIGLALVQDLIHLHQGTITVSSTPEKGTTFGVSLPRGKAHIPAEHLGKEQLAPFAMQTNAYVEEALRWLPDEPAFTEEWESRLSTPFIPTKQEIDAPLLQKQDFLSPVSRPRVLIIDDNADMREYLTRLLAPFYELKVAVEGQQALTMIKADPPDLVISDVMMPGIDGFELLTLLRSEAATRAIPFLLLSARAGEDAVLQGLQAGADDYLIKPFSARELLARVQARLEISRLLREIEQARRQLYDLLQQAPAVICILRGPQHVYELVNPLYQQIVGYRDILGKPIREALPELQGQGIYEILDEVYRTGNSYTGKEVSVFIDRQGNGKPQEVFFNFVYQTFLSRNNTIEGILVHAVDVTDQVHARQRMDTFLGIAGHELRNPLTSIKGNLQLARRRIRQVLQEATTESMSHIQQITTIDTLLMRAERQIDFQNRLVGDLIDTARIQADKLDFRMLDSDLYSLIQEEVEEQRRLNPTRSIQLSFSQEEHPILSLDAERIGQVVTNYLTNALKYSASDKPVVVQAELLAEQVRVSVIDQGPGLDLEYQQEIWQRFYRAPGVEVQSGTGIGLGLGLHICRVIIEHHGGHVGVVSQPGEGSTFWFTLPLELKSKQEHIQSQL